MTVKGKTRHPKTGPELTYEQAMALYIVSSDSGKISTVRECPGDEFRTIIRQAALTSPAVTTLAHDMERMQWDNPVDRWWILCRMLEFEVSLPCTADCSTLLAQYADARRKKSVAVG